MEIKITYSNMDAPSYFGALIFGYCTSVKTGTPGLVFLIYWTAVHILYQTGYIVVIGSLSDVWFYESRFEPLLIGCVAGWFQLFVHSEIYTGSRRMYVLNPWSSVGKRQFAGWPYWGLIVVLVAFQWIALVVYEITTWLGVPLMEIMVGIVFAVLDIAGLMFVQAGEVDVKIETEFSRGAMKQGFAWQFVLSFAGLAIICFSLFWRNMWWILGPNGEDWAVQMIAAGTVTVVLGASVVIVCILHKIYANHEDEQEVEYLKKYPKGSVAKKINRRIYDDKVYVRD